ncbi:hypothetical protein D0867_15172 [Hortaea werneckii]|uniref:laccase n=1 Tax=Hortaea werneckii TaxID=91943 RepID=A0A3M6XJB1_HORWE|nr:hypothetical protein D0867_15172 [Hortaea werneckii]
MKIFSFLAILCIGGNASTTALPGLLEGRATTSSSTKKTTSTSNVKTSTKTSTGTTAKTSSSTSSKATTSLASLTSSTSTKTSSATTSTRTADSSCKNTAFTRQCWGNGFSIAADFDNKWPVTGKTRYYELTFTNGTGSPDGGPSRPLFLINNQFPGPTIYADWGDTVQVTVHNKLEANGTGIHWHGIRQKNSNTEDGVPGITECPLAPGDTKVYTFTATQYGTSWYHSHWSSQYGDGILGAMVINGPATANYDLDLGPLMVMDWYYTPAATLAWRSAHIGGRPATADNALINGTNKSPSGSTGKYHTMTATKGKKYRLRIINTSVDNHFMVSLDNHPFQVITSDFVPIKPYYADWIFLGIGQRYDVVINANQTSGNYWFRALVPGGCGTNSNTDIKSIFHYADAAIGDPTSSAKSVTPRCTDEKGLQPYWDSFVPEGPLANGAELNVSIQVGLDFDGSTLVKWGVNFSALSVVWDYPILQQVIDGNETYPSNANLIELSKPGEWYYWIIQEVAGTAPVNVPHPIHLHGHDFYILGTGLGDFTEDDLPNLDYNNPARRDVAMLDAGGWLVIAFQTDNPGAWIMHCHIAWHAGEGLAVQFLETKDQIPGIRAPSTDWTETCANWKTFYPEDATYLRDSGDSGI